MAITDYIYQEETVQKKDFGIWLVDKMLAAGWQQIGSNPPPATGASALAQFYVMKGRRASDNTDVYVALNDYKLRTAANTAYSAQLNIVPLLDYTPGTAGTDGTTSQGVTPITQAKQGSTNGPIHSSNLVANYSYGSFPLETPFVVRYCITAHSVTLIIRVSSYYGNQKGGYTFFGLPDILAKEKNGGATIMVCSHTGTTSNSSMIIADSPLNLPSLSNYGTMNPYSFTSPKSPDIHGNFPLMIVYGGDSGTGLRIRIPSVFFLQNGGLLDKDVIQYENMTFEVLDPALKMTDNFLNGYIVYRIA